MKTFWKIVFGSLLGCILASIVGYLLFFAFVGSIAGLAGKSASVPAGEKILRIDLSQSIPEQNEESFRFSAAGPSFGSSLSLYTVVKAIEAAARADGLPCLEKGYIRVVLEFSECSCCNG